MALILAVGAVFAARACVSRTIARIAKEPKILSRSKGNLNARFEIIEYTDFQCPQCRLVAAVIEPYLQHYPSEIFYEVRFRPIISTHRHALKSAIYAECAARQNKFWLFHDTLFAHQDEWAHRESADDTFRAYAKDLKLSLEKLDACVRDPSTKQAVMAQKNDALSMGILSTPTFLVNGKMIMGPEALEEELQRMFKKDK